MLLFAVRILMKYLFEQVRGAGSRRRVFIYGTKAGGMALAKSIRMETTSGFQLQGFVSDSNDMPGHMLQGGEIHTVRNSCVDQAHDQQKS